MKTEARVRKQAFVTSKLVSLAMEDAQGKYFDAKAFGRSASAMQALAQASVNEMLTLDGHWEVNPKNGLDTFVVDAVAKPDDIANAGYVCEGDKLYWNEWGSPTYTLVEGAEQIKPCVFKLANGEILDWVCPKF